MLQTGHRERALLRVDEPDQVRRPDALLENEHRRLGRRVRELPRLEVDDEMDLVLLDEELAQRNGILRRAEEEALR